MHGTFDRSGKTGKSVNPNSSLRLVVIPALLAVALVALAIMATQCFPLDIGCGAGRVRRHLPGAGRRPDPARAAGGRPPQRQIRLTLPAGGKTGR